MTQDIQREFTRVSPGLPSCSRRQLQTSFSDADKRFLFIQTTTGAFSDGVGHLLGGLYTQCCDGTSV